MIELENVNVVEINGKTVTQLEINGEKIWKRISYKNWVKYSVETDGTPYNGGLGYKNRTRVRSGGVETADSTCVCTGFIPYKAGDVLEIYSPETTAFSGVSYINVSDADKTNTGQIATNGKYGIFNVSGSWSSYVTVLDNGVRRFVLPTTLSGAENVAFVRVTVGFETANSTTGDGMIITVNEEITE